MPYRVPAWAFKTIGTSTMQLARKIVSTASSQFMPRSIIDDAIMYVGTQADMLIQRTARSRVPHFRPAAGTGARSWP